MWGALPKAVIHLELNVQAPQSYQKILCVPQKSDELPCEYVKGAGSLPKVVIHLELNVLAPSSGGMKSMYLFSMFLLSLTESSIG